MAFRKSKGFCSWVDDQSLRNRRLARGYHAGRLFPSIYVIILLSVCSTTTNTLDPNLEKVSFSICGGLALIGVTHGIGERVSDLTFEELFSALKVLLFLFLFLANVLILSRHGGSARSSILWLPALSKQPLDSFISASHPRKLISVSSTPL
jgi:hypothetical protein